MNNLKNLWEMFRLRKQLHLDRLEFPDFNKPTKLELEYWKMALYPARFEQDFPSVQPSLHITKNENLIIYHFNKLRRRCGKTTFIINIINALDGQNCAYFSLFGRDMFLGFKRTNKITNKNSTGYSLNKVLNDINNIRGTTFDHFFFDDFNYFYDAHSEEYKCVIEYIKTCRNPKCKTSFVILM